MKKIEQEITTRITKLMETVKDWKDDYIVEDRSDHGIEEGTETTCIKCGGYSQFFGNRQHYYCFDCGHYWQPNRNI